METKLKVGIIIGRFAPFHNGHLEILKHCNKNYDKTLVLVGSSNVERSIKNPFEPSLIANWIDNISNENTIVRQSFDFNNDEDWISHIENHALELFDSDLHEFSIVGHNKDESSYYLKIFPNWGVDELPNFENGLNATDIRNILFSDNIKIDLNKVKKLVPNLVFNDLVKFVNSTEFKNFKS